ncbi:MAG: DUF58 domain-containing protein [Alphaproteobacteria bacterium]|nr:DUF58 domain-containing protein [Alphaproteobacteria bacterium]MCB9694702.1 DUF58 domain-containing protein [Alphaproteobacteria bacterium]
MSTLTAEELRELRRLHLAAGRKVDSLFAGDYRSAVRGQGMEFEEVREYSPGDDVRHIDWNVTARTGEPFVKVFREERQLTVLLVVDVSGSTRVGSGGRDGRTDRRLQIARVAGGLAYASIRNQDRIGLVTFSDRVEAFLTPRRSRGHAWAVIQKVFEGTGNHRGTSLPEAFRFVRQVQRRRAVVILISDFLDASDWDTQLGSLARRHKVHALLVSDPLDEGLRKLGLVEAVDAETGRRRVIDGLTARGVQTVDARLKRLRRTGAGAVAISTEDDPYQILHGYFQREVARR